MKIRNGFVSNSSSSSFCIYKKLMTEEQIKEFRKIVGEAYEHDDETYIGEDGDYFIGTLSMHDDMVHDFLHRNFKRNDWADCC